VAQPPTLYYHAFICCELNYLSGRAVIKVKELVAQPQPFTTMHLYVVN